jgi:DNA polymerase I
MVKYLIYDTETTGLNIVTDRPFMYVYGLVDEKLNLIEEGLFRSDNLKERQRFEKLIKSVDTLVGHNIKFDLHQAINDGFDPALFKDKNYIDTSVLARLVISHDIQTEGTFTVALKKLGIRYLGIDSAYEEQQLKLELSRLTMEHKNKMKAHFVMKGLWDFSKTATEQTKMINEIYNSWNKIFHNYPQLFQARKEFVENNPAPTYADCSNIETYAITDIKLTFGLFKLWYPMVVKLQQVPTLTRISRVTFPLMLMERKGLTVDLKRLVNDRQAILKELSKTKIIDPRNGEELKIGQHAKLKNLYEYESGMLLSSADKNIRSEIEDISPSAKKANYLAKMEKYLSTYITGILNKVKPINGEFKVYTQYNLAGTVTGRLSSDFQQFPKEPLLLESGYEVNIRSWFIVPNQDKYMFYFDYSQMELRLQCEWTNIVNGQPDLNLARAFTPYKCIQVGDDYFLEENPSKIWEPVDLHGLTAKNAFPGIDENDLDWKHYRSLGKRTNFAVNYGAAAPKIQEALKVDFPTAKALVDGYKKTFPGVVAFGKWISNRVYVTDNIPNLLLRRYYSRNKHQLQNWLVQGSGADILLEKIKEVHDYIKDKPHWNFMITVHDELGLTCKDIPEAQLKVEVARIRELLCYQLSAVDVTADVEYTETCWSEKDEWKE